MILVWYVSSVIEFSHCCGQALTSANNNTCNVTVITMPGPLLP